MATVPVTMQFKVVDGASRALDEITQRLKQMNSGAGQFNKVIESSSAKISEFTKASKMVGKGMLVAGTALTAGITAPVVAFGVSALKAGADYEQAMNDLRARTQSSTQDMALLSAEARRLGISTVFGATDASKAMTELGKAGFTTQQIIASTGSVLNLAAAESMDMGAAATLVSDTINQFGLKAEDATAVVDMLGKAAGISSIDVNQLQNSLKYAAPEAARFGIKLEEVAGAIAQLGSRGIKSEMAGTTLRNFFNSITSDTERQAKLMKAGVFGKDLFKNKDTLKSLPEMIAALKAAKLSATALSDIFGKEFGGNIAALIKDSDKLGQTIADVANSSGFEAGVASARTSGWNGEIQKLKNSFEELGIALAYGADGQDSFLSKLTYGVSIVKDMVLWVGQLNPGLQTAILWFVGIAAAIGPVLLGLGGLIFSIGEIITASGVVWGILTAVGSALVGVAAAFGPIILIVGAVVGALALLVIYWQEVVDMFKTFGNVIVDIINDISPIFGFASKLQGFSSTLGTESTVRMPQQNFAQRTSGLGSFKPQAPALDQGNFADFYSPKNTEQTNKSEVLIKLGGAVPFGTTATVAPNSDAFVKLDVGRAMQ